MILTPQEAKALQQEMIAALKRKKAGFTQSPMSGESKATDQTSASFPDHSMTDDLDCVLPLNPETRTPILHRNQTIRTGDTTMTITQTIQTRIPLSSIEMFLVLGIINDTLSNGDPQEAGGFYLIGGSTLIPTILASQT
jgi:hypothetical protein